MPGVLHPIPSPPQSSTNLPYLSAPHTCLIHPLFSSPLQKKEKTASDDISHAGEQLRVQVFTTRVRSAQFQGDRLRDYASFQKRNKSLPGGGYSHKVGNTIVSQEMDSKDCRCCNPTISAQSGPIVCMYEVLVMPIGKCVHDDPEDVSPPKTPQEWRH